MENISKILTDIVVKACLQLNNDISIDILSCIKVIPFIGDQYDYTCRNLVPLHRKYFNILSLKEFLIKIIELLNENLKNIVSIFIDEPYLNFKLSTSYLIDSINRSFSSNLSITDFSPKRVLVDFSSPNSAKALHAGHLRSTIIGDSICRILEYQGHEVHRINHIGDFGFPFGMIVTYITNNKIDMNNLKNEDLQNIYCQAKKSFDLGEKVKDTLLKVLELEADKQELLDFSKKFILNENHTNHVQCSKSLSIQEINETLENFKYFDFYRDSYMNTVKLQSGNTSSEAYQIWLKIKELSRSSYQPIYDRLDIKLQEVGESFYASQIPSLLAELDQKGLLEKKDGRIIFKKTSNLLPEKKKIEKKPKSNELKSNELKSNELKSNELNSDKSTNEKAKKELVLTLVKRDGGYTYDTTDLAAIRYRLINLRMDQIIYVVDNGQSEHFRLIFEAAKEAGWITPNVKVEHVGFGVVRLPGKGKLRSRDGNTIKLSDILDEAIEKTKESREENKLLDPKIVESIAYAAVKYNDLSKTRTHDIDFSFEKMLALNGNTAPYLLYANVRVQSILKHIPNLDANEFIINLELNHSEELGLVKKLLQFKEVLDVVSEDFFLHKLSDYAYNLSKQLHKFFEKCPCIEYDKNIQNINESSDISDSNESKVSLLEIKSINYNRVTLCYKTHLTLELCLQLLGINPVTKM